MNKLLKIGAAAILAASVLVGCGSKGGSDDDKTIKVGATAVPHAMIFNDVVKYSLAKYVLNL